MIYNYEWGWDNYATGVFEVNTTLAVQIDAPGGPLLSPDYNIIWTVSGGAYKGSHNWGANNYLPGSRLELSRSFDAVFKASDFFQTNTDNVMISLNMGVPSPSSAYLNGEMTANSNTVIDWENILSLIAAATGS